MSELVLKSAWNNKQHICSCCHTKIIVAEALSTWTILKSFRFCIFALPDQSATLQHFPRGGGQPSLSSAWPVQDQWSRHLGNLPWGRRRNWRGFRSLYLDKDVPYFLQNYVASVCTADRLLSHDTYWVLLCGADLAFVAIILPLGVCMYIPATFTIGNRDNSGHMWKTWRVSWAVQFHLQLYVLQ